MGWENLAYVGMMALVSVAMGSFSFFLLTTGYVHYLLYIGTFADRRSVSFGRFKRNSLFFRGVSLASLSGVYLYYFTFDPISLLLIFTGLFVSGLAFQQLGVNRSMFGYELGWCEPKEINAFPYGSIPHPMITGSIIFMLGVYLHDPMRAAFPWLIPLHIGFYLLHIWQEIVAGAPQIELPEQQIELPEQAVQV